MDMEFIIGETGTHIKETTLKICVLDKENYFIKINSYIKENGLMDRNNKKLVSLLKRKEIF